MQWLYNYHDSRDDEILYRYIGCIRNALVGWSWKLVAWNNGTVKIKTNFHMLCILSWDVRDSW